MLDVFITSPEKGSGKTIVTAGIAATLQSLGYSTSVYAPVHLGGVEKDGFLEAPDLSYIKNTDSN
ncbi:dethiobiotin synthase, partial [bacterium]|nr:dethiobiotin synthase [bacterium]